MKTFKEIVESSGSIIRKFMKKKKEHDVKYDAPWHIRPQGKTIDRPNTGIEPQVKKKDTFHESEKATERTKKMIKVSHTGPVGYRIADIGPGKKESNVKVGVSTLKEGETPTVQESAAHKANVIKKIVKKKKEESDTKLSGKTEKFFDDPSVNVVNQLNGVGI